MAIRSDDIGKNEPENQQQEEQVEEQEEEQEDGIFIPTYITLHIKYYLQKKASSVILGQMKY